MGEKMGTFIRRGNKVIKTLQIGSAVIITALVIWGVFFDDPKLSAKDKNNWDTRVGNIMYELQANYFQVILLSNQGIISSSNLKKLDNLGEKAGDLINKADSDGVITRKEAKKVEAAYKKALDFSSQMLNNVPGYQN